MGAEVFYDEGYGNSAREVFNVLVEDACYEYGHGGYSGTIAEKPSFTMIPFDVDGDVTAEEYAYTLINRGDERIDDKWGPAGCMELKSDQEGLRKFCFFGWASS